MYLDGNVYETTQSKEHDAAELNGIVCEDVHL